MESGNLSMEPNFDQMPRKELLAYVLNHRDDLEAIDTLVNRSIPDSEATWYPAPLTEETLRISEEAIRQHIKRKKQGKPNLQS